MGANQSTVPVNEKLLAERLQGIRIRDKEEHKCQESTQNITDDEYVHLDEKSGHFEAPWSSLSVGDVEDWEHELLADSKNRCELC